MAEKRKISLVLADVDGTLVTKEKILTERARKTVSALQEAGIRFVITSGRPPLDMAMLFDVPAAVTDSYNEEGFAKAMEAFILRSAR